MYLSRSSAFGQVPGVPTALTAPRTRDIRIVVKSFIAPIGPRTSVTRCAITDPSSIVKLRALGVATDLAFSENPLTDAKDKRYRLYSQRTFRVTCQGDRLVSAIPSALDADAGTECLPRTRVCLQPPGLVVSGVWGRRSGPSTFDFGWTAKGRPHLAAEPAFQVVCPRTSVYIWHTVSGRIDCSAPEIRVDVRLAGSAFPSHRVFVNGTAVSAIPQGVFARLWIPDRSDLTKVA